MSRPTAEEVMALVELRDGALFRLDRGRPVKVYVNPRGYRALAIKRYYFLEHRVVWLLTHGEWPKHGLDHINGDQADNRIENLRDVPQQINCRNRKRNKNNKSGMGGVYYYTTRRSWRAIIRTDAAFKCLGDFATREEAIAARAAAQTVFGYTSSHGLR